MQALFAPSPEAIPGLAEFVPHMRVLVEDLTLRNDDALRSLSLQAFPLLTLWLLLLAAPRGFEYAARAKLLGITLIRAA